MPERPNRKIQQIIFAGLMLAIGACVIFAIFSSPGWNVPESAKQTRNPLASSPAVLQAARSTYDDQCAKCHGASGHGDGPEAKNHFSRPSDLTDLRRMGSMTDGELFYKTSVGKKPMPAFKKRLTEERIWQLVILMRTFSVPGRTG